jgi:hypothetical protein
MLAHNADGSPNYAVRCVTSDEGAVDRPGLRTLLAELFENAEDADILFYFAGHGAQTPWGVELVTQDLIANSLGVSLADVVTLANGSPARDVVLILDCCSSGDLANEVVAGRRDRDIRHAVLTEGVTILTSSRPVQASTEAEGHGSFTRRLLDGLDGGAADLVGHVTSLSLYAFVSGSFGAWDQRPMFKSHVTRPSVLRRCEPWIERALLRRLPELFPSAEARLRMSPAYEGQGRPLPPGVPGTREQHAFDSFKQLRNAGLLAVEEGADLYFAAMRSLEVFLTPIGRHYWRLARGRHL